MTPVTRLLEAANRGDQQAAVELMPLVYDELRKLAAARMAHEQPDHTLQPTALVHEAYLRLVGDQQFDGRRHFFAAAAEAMRRILVESARSRQSLKRGGDQHRNNLDNNIVQDAVPVEEILGVHEVLDQLAMRDANSAMLVKLHFFAGLTLEESADAIGLPHRTAYRDWQYARVWLYRKLGGEPTASE